MADSTGISLPNVAWGVLGAAVAYLGKWVLGAIQAGKARENAAKDETIALLKADVVRLTGERDKLGDKYDALQRTLTDERMRTASMMVAARPDPRVPTEWEAEAPTGVRNIANVALHASQKPHADPFAHLEGWTADKTPTR